MKKKKQGTSTHLVNETNRQGEEAGERGYKNSLLQDCGSQNLKCLK